MVMTSGLVYGRGAISAETGVSAPVFARNFKILIHPVNGLTNEAVGKPLLKHELKESLSFPEAENSHRYEDAHKELYGYLIDGLDSECISLLATRLGRPIKAREKWTVQDLKKL